MKMVLFGNGEASDPLRAIADALRDRQVRALTYVNDHVPLASRELEDTNFLILGLSRASREKSSNAHAKEKEVLFAASRLTVNRPHIAIVRDIDGWISAPYLTMTGLAVAYLFTGCQPFPDELFNNAIKTGIGDPIVEADRIAEILRSSLRI